MLFPDMTRSEMDGKSDEESEYSYLNRSARLEALRVREVLEDWFSRYPESEKRAFRSRFCSDDDISYFSSFFELYLHELLVRLNYTVRIEPESPSGKRPDFFVRSSDGSEFYMEAVLATGMSDEEMGARKRESVVYGSLEKIRSADFFVCMNIFGNPTEPLSGRKLIKTIESWLLSLKYEDILEEWNRGGVALMPKLLYSEKGWNIEFWPKPKKSTRNKPGVRPIGVKYFGFRFRDSRTALRDAIIRKATRYGELGKPYVVAVNHLEWPLDEIAIMEALFGKEQWLVPRLSDRGSEAQMTRVPDGAWTSESGPTNTRVSAVLLGCAIHPWSFADDKREPLLCHNPWAQFSCSGKITELSQLIYRNDAMWKRDGAHPRNLMGLPNGWPELDEN